MDVLQKPVDPKQGKPRVAFAYQQYTPSDSVWKLPLDCHSEPFAVILSEAKGLS